MPQLGLQSKIKNKNRKLNRLNNYDYSQNGWYFITICTNDRIEWFGKIKNRKMFLNELGKITERCWLEIPKHFPNFVLDEFIIMPNHIHGIVVINNNIVGNKDFCSVRGNKNVGNKNFCSVQGNNNYCSVQGNNDYCSPQGDKWQTKWAKSISSMVRGFKIGVTKWCRQNNNHQFAWQKSFYDHIIRNEKSLNQIRQYIIDNPLKWEFNRNNLN